MGYIRLLRPSRTEEGGYRFDPFDEETGMGGHVEIGGLNIYGLGYIGAQAGSHVERIGEAVTTENNLLLFHVGIWTFSPVEIGNMKPEDSTLGRNLRLRGSWSWSQALYRRNPEGKDYAYNPGSPEQVNSASRSTTRAITSSQSMTASMRLSPRPHHQGR